MRHLLVCGRCQRQLDAGDRGPGEWVRCACGELVEVPALAPHDSAVVRCSACGAPREGGEAECRYCGSSFTVHELDIDTICPSCMARVSGGARFCSHCGCPILVDQAAAGGTPLRCPACGPAVHLASRRLGGEPVAVSECELCGGLWVDSATFDVLAARARHGQLGSAALALGRRPAEGAAGSGAGTAGTAGTGNAMGAAGSGGGRLYRPCAWCGALMNRQNYGRKSGVILDVCGAHGIWFDLDELPRVLAWIQHGGEQRAHQLDAEETQAEARRQRLERESQLPLDSRWAYAEHDPDLLNSLAGLLGEGVSRLFRRG
jgi:Zn-finger nucleic acid-binding protein